jgi:hypothetical protein
LKNAFWRKRYIFSRTSVWSRIHSVQIWNYVWITNSRRPTLLLRCGISGGSNRTVIKGRGFVIQRDRRSHDRFAMTTLQALPTTNWFFPNKKK